MQTLGNARQMYSVINKLGMTAKPFSVHDVYNELAKRGITPGHEFRAVIEDYLRNIAQQEFILVVGNSEPFPHPGLFLASEQFLYLGEITPGCIENGIDLSSIAMFATLGELRKQNKK